MSKDDKNSMSDPEKDAMARRIAELETQLAARPQTGVAPKGGRLVARHALALAIDGRRVEVAPGEAFEASGEALAGLTYGVDYEQAPPQASPSAPLGPTGPQPPEGGARGR